YTSYALAADGSVYSWGYNNAGELGNGNWNSTYEYLYEWCHHCCVWCCHCRCYGEYWAAIRDANAYTPVKVVNPGATINYGAGYHDTSYQSSSAGKFYTYLGNYGSELNGTHWISSISGGYLSNAVQIAAGRDFAIVLRADGTVIYWGNSGTYQSVEYLNVDFSEPGMMYPVDKDGYHGHGEHDNSPHGFTYDALRHFGTAMRAGDAILGESHTRVFDSEHAATDSSYSYQGVSGSYNATSYSDASHYITKLVPVTVLGLHGTSYLGDNTLNADADKTTDGTPSPTTSKYSATANSSMTAGNYGARITKLVAGDEFSAALTSSGTVFTWGINSKGSSSQMTQQGDHQHGGRYWYTPSWDSPGALGDGSILDRIYPVQVKAGEQSTSTNYLTDIVDIASGDGHIIALDGAGQVWAWGDNTYGQLGNGKSGGYSTLPVKVLLTGNHNNVPITRIFAGGNPSMAIDAEGHIYAWGDNSKGQVGQVGVNTVTQPSLVAAGESRDSGTAGVLSTEPFLGAQSVAVNHYQTTIYKNDVLIPDENGLLTQEAHVGGTVYAMGTYGSGTFLYGTLNRMNEKGYEHHYMGGSNALGDSKSVSSPNVPVLVGSPDDESIYIGQVAYVTDFKLGDKATVTYRDFDHALTQHTLRSATASTEAGTATTGHLNVERTILTEGDAIRIPMTYTKTTTPGVATEENPDPADVTTTETVTNLQRYITVGTNLYRTSGVQDTEDFLFPFESTDVVGASGIDKGVHTRTTRALQTGDFTVISSDESILTVYVNAAEGYYELRTMPNAFGNVTVLIRENTTQITRIINLIVRAKEDRTESPNAKLTTPKIVYGEHFALALKADGTVWAWGDNTYGQLGDGTSGSGAYEYSPVQVRAANGNDYLRGIADIAAGAYHSFAISAPDAVTGEVTVWAWGLNSNGQLGIGNTSNQRYPVAVNTSNVTGHIVQISGGYNHSLAVTDVGYAYGWGATGTRAVNWRENSSADRTTPYRLERNGLVNNAENNSNLIYNEGYFTNIESVYAGRNYSILRSTGGYVYAFGSMPGVGYNIGDYNVLGTHSFSTQRPDGSYAPMESIQRVPMVVREGSQVNGVGNYLRDVTLIATGFSADANDHILLLGMNQVGTEDGEAVPTNVTGETAKYIRSDKSGALFAIGSGAQKQLTPESTANATRPILVNGLTKGYSVTTGSGESAETTTVAAQLAATDR
ncbi:MAG: hypothetical protein NC311_18175, partial [Muribaculaceae bacterium]|nr:hypothetical protein [Muribaculaceae bacterium]